MADDFPTPAEQQANKNPTLRAAVDENIRKSAEQQQQIAKGMLDPNTLTDAAASTPAHVEQRENLAQMREREARRMGGTTQEQATGNSHIDLLTNALSELQTKYLALEKRVTALESRQPGTTSNPTFPES